MIAGARVIGSAITRVCPLSALFRIDSRSTREMMRDWDETLASRRTDLGSYQEQVVVVSDRPPNEPHHDRRKSHWASVDGC